LDRNHRIIQVSYKHRNIRVVAYLSAEYLLGPHLLNDLLNLGLTEECNEAFKELGIDLATVAAQEPEPGLGNGGLGRLAACFMDSLSTLGVPAIGYGLRYEFGMFRQEIRDGWQVERSDKSYKKECPIKRNVKRKTSPIGSIPPHSCLGIQPHSLSVHS